MVERRSRYRGALLGLAAGDALGTTLEFKPRGSFAPLTRKAGIVGGGPFELEAGQWTDDTSMALCLAASLLHVGGFDARDQMTRYTNWYQWGYMSSNGRCFDIGNTVREALDAFAATGDPWSGPTAPNRAGNGCIMRLAPVPMFFDGSAEDAAGWSAMSSRTTHGADECVEASGLMGEMLWRLLGGASKEEAVTGPFLTVGSTDGIRAIAAADYRTKSYDQVHGTGYVVAGLEAALWCFVHTDTFADAVLAAANLGDDADTTAAICGQLAGAFYGVGGSDGIPEDWVAQLTDTSTIDGLAVALMEEGG